MTTLSKQSLLSYENLSLPSMQVIVMRADMGCKRCRERVSYVVSKMTGLHDCTVDIINKQVTVKGDFIKPAIFQECFRARAKRRSSPLAAIFKVLAAACFNQSFADPGHKA